MKKTVEADIFLTTTRKGNTIRSGELPPGIYWQECTKGITNRWCYQPLQPTLMPSQNETSVLQRIRRCRTADRRDRCVVIVTEVPGAEG